MADKKASAFTPSTTLDTNTRFMSVRVGSTDNFLHSWETMRDGVLSATKSTQSASAAATKSVSSGKWLVAVAVTNSGGSTRTVSIGTTLGGGEIVDTVSVAAGATETFNTSVFGATGGTTLHLTPSGALTFSYLEI